jgi:hypothetical protein
MIILLRIQKQIVMKKFIFFLSALLLPLFALDISADDENATMKIPLKSDSQQNLNRTLVYEPIDCHYHGMMTSIVTTFSNDLGNVTFTVTNCSTGETWYDVIDSAIEPQFIMPISGTDGLYEIIYITENGDIYEGSFYLN